jgi:hypothetical protein
VIPLEQQIDDQLIAGRTAWQVTKANRAQRLIDTMTPFLAVVRADLQQRFEFIDKKFLEREWIFHSPPSLGTKFVLRLQVRDFAPIEVLYEVSKNYVTHTLEWQRSGFATFDLGFLRYRISKLVHTHYSPNWDRALFQYEYCGSFAEALAIAGANSPIH